MSNDKYNLIESNLKKYKPELAQSSVNMIMRNIKLLNKRITGNDKIKSLTFLYNVKEIMDNLENFSKLTKRNYLHSINYIIESNLPDDDTTKKLNNFYTERRNEINSEYMNNALNNIKSDKTEKNWITAEEYDDVIMKLKKIVDGFGNTINRKQLTTFQRYLIISIYKYHPLRVDLHNMKVIEENQDKNLDKSFNYLIKLNNGNYQFKIYNFKTKKTHKMLLINLNENLNEIIKDFLEVNKSGWFIVQEQDPSKPIQKSGLTNLIIRTFKRHAGKNIGVNMIRKIIVSDHFAEFDKAQKQMASDMGHNQRTNSLYIKY